MKKKIIWLSSCILLLLIGGIIMFLFGNSSKDGILHVNGVDVTKENIVIRPKYAELPLTEIMKSLGMNIEWFDNDTAEITYGYKKYTLNLSDISLVEAEQNVNLLLPPPGGSRFYKVLERELILDSNTIKSVLYQIGKKVNIDINRDELIVYIIERTD